MDILKGYDATTTAGGVKPTPLGVDLTPKQMLDELMALSGMPANRQQDASPKYDHAQGAQPYAGAKESIVIPLASDSGPKPANASPFDTIVETAFRACCAVQDCANCGMKK